MLLAGSRLSSVHFPPTEEPVQRNKAATVHNRLGEGKGSIICSFKLGGGGRRVAGVSKK